MAFHPLQSAGLRFIRKFGVALAWALFYGMMFGSVAYIRPPEAMDVEVKGLLRLGRALDRLELFTYDARVRSAVAHARKTDDVVVVSVDAETLASARATTQARLSRRPWPRGVFGQLAEQAVREGASAVVFANSFEESSVEQCDGQRSSNDDDATFANSLHSLGAKASVAIAASVQTQSPPYVEFRPVLIKIADGTSDVVRKTVAQVLLLGTTAIVNTSSAGSEIWASATSEESAKRIATTLHAKTPLVIRSRTPDDADHEIDATEWLAQNINFPIDGADPADFPELKVLIPPVSALLSENTGYGVSLPRTDFDRLLRTHVPLWVYRDSKGLAHFVPSLALLGAWKGLGQPTVSFRNGELWLGENHHFPIYSKNNFWLRWDAQDLGDGRLSVTKRQLPAWRLWTNAQDANVQHQIRPYDNALDGRIVVFEEEERNGSTVTSAVGSATVTQRLSQAMINMLHGDYIWRTDRKTDFYWTLWAAAFGAFLAVICAGFIRGSGWLQYTLFLGVIAGGYYYAALWVLETKHQWVPVVAPMLALMATFLSALGYANALERSVFNFVRGALGSALSPEIIRRMERNVGLLKPAKKTLAVYYSDIAGFTRLAQSLDPRAMVSLVQKHLSQCTHHIHDTRGQVDKYLGEGMMAFWGAPIEIDHPAVQACEGAWRMWQQFEQQKGEWEKVATQPLTLSAGIDLGECVVGEMGTEHRTNYTVMGETVSIAARLERLCEEYGAKILVSPRVMESAKNRFVFRSIAKVKFHPQGSEVEIFELVSRVDEAAK